MHAARKVLCTTRYDDSDNSMIMSVLTSNPV